MTQTFIPAVFMRFAGTWIADSAVVDRMARRLMPGQVAMPSQ